MASSNAEERAQASPGEMSQWCFLDMEASGIAPDSYPIEIAVVSADWTFHDFIRPARYWSHWCHDAQDMHGLQREWLVTHGKPAFDVASRLNSLANGCVLLIDSPLDHFWLEVLFEAADLEFSFKIELIEKFLNQKQQALFLAALPKGKAHRAIPDAVANQQAFTVATSSYFRSHAKCLV